MTKRTFTADDGEKYEAETTKLAGGGYLIKPIPKAVEKHPYSLKMWQDDDGKEQYLVEKGYGLTNPQAQAVAAAIKALMEDIQTANPDSTIIWRVDDRVVEAITKARAALREDV